MNVINAMSTAQLLPFHPVCTLPEPQKAAYFADLKQFINGNLLLNRYISAQLHSYHKALCTDTSQTKKEKNKQTQLPHFRLLLLFDLIHICGYDPKYLYRPSIDRVIEYIGKTYSVPTHFLRIVVSAALGNLSDIRQLLSREYPPAYKEYMVRFLQNALFIHQKPFSILVTATMSAGKSTFINMLTGKRVSLSQNTACTAKIHSIISQPFEDHLTTEFDYELNLNATEKELLNDCEENVSDDIYVSTFFQGGLGGKRFIIKDSPGVNASQFPEHRRIAVNQIVSRAYDLCIILLDATQLHTNDMHDHLKLIHDNIGNKPVLFIMNKVDEFYKEGMEGILSAIMQLSKILQEEFHFISPLICPVSSRAGFIAKTINMSEPEFKTQFRTFKDIDLSKYYQDTFTAFSHEDVSVDASKADILLRRCGLYYIEHMIRRFIEKTGGLQYV